MTAEIGLAEYWSDVNRTQRQHFKYAHGVCQHVAGAFFICLCSPKKAGTFFKFLQPGFETTGVSMLIFVVTETFHLMHDLHSPLLNT